jgi:hypothetical protein
MTRFAFLDQTQTLVEFADDGTPTAFVTQTGKRGLIGALTPAEHAPAGSAKGGQFVSKGGGSSGGGPAKKAPAAKSAAPAKKAAKNDPAHRAPPGNVKFSKASHPHEVGSMVNTKWGSAKVVGLSYKGASPSYFVRKEDGGRMEVVNADIQDPVAAKKEAPAKAPPQSITHKGAKYIQTGKKGEHLAFGEASHEYEKVDASGKRTGARVWQTSSGKTYED